MSKTTEDPDRDWGALRRAQQPPMSLDDVASRTGINKGLLSQVENRELRVTPKMARTLLKVYREVR